MLAGLTSSTGTTWLDVLITLITGICVVAAAVVPSLLIFRNRRKSDEKADQHQEILVGTLGVKNGKGTAMEILGRQEHWSLEHDRRDNWRFGLAAAAGCVLAVAVFRRSPR